MQYWSRCNIFNSFGNTLLFRYIYKGRIVKISANIAFLFYKEIYMKYLGTYKVRNEIETKRNETKRNQQKRNETKRNQRNENEIKRNQRKQNEINENKTK